MIVDETKFELSVQNVSLRCIKMTLNEYEMLHNLSLHTRFYFHELIGFQQPRKRFRFLKRKIVVKLFESLLHWSPRNAFSSSQRYSNTKIVETFDLEAME